MAHELRISLRKLEKIQAQVGVANNTKGKGKRTVDDAAVDTSNMTEYEKQQYNMALYMKEVREGVAAMDELKGSSDNAARVKMSNEIRKSLALMKRQQGTLKELARKEGKLDAFDTMCSHAKKTEELYRSRFGTAPAAADTGADAHAGGFGSQSSTEMQNFGQPMMGVTEDEEFQTWMHEVKMRDKKMDDTLDMISDGLGRMKKTALGIQDELKKQDLMLDETNRLADQAQSDLDNMNRRMKKITEQVKADSCCLYIVCLLLLLAIGGAIFSFIF